MQPLSILTPGAAASKEDTPRLADFFSSAHESPLDSLQQHILARYAQDVASFYSPAPASNTLGVPGFLSQSWPATPTVSDMATVSGQIMLDMGPAEGASPLDTLLWACIPGAPSSFVMPSGFGRTPSEDATPPLSFPFVSGHDSSTGIMSPICLPTPTSAHLTQTMAATPTGSALPAKITKKAKKPLPPKINTSMATCSPVAHMNGEEEGDANAPPSTTTATPASEADQVSFNSVLSSTEPCPSVPIHLAHLLYSHIPEGSNLPPPRPPNAFILYRRHQSAHLRRVHPGTHLRVVSRVVSKWWRESSEEERGKWREVADAAKKEHNRRWPEYRYRPKAEQQQSGHSSTPGALKSAASAKSRVRGSGGKGKRDVDEDMSGLDGGVDDVTISSGGWMGAVMDESATMDPDVERIMALMSDASGHPTPTPWWEQPLEMTSMTDVDMISDVTALAGMLWG